MNKEQLLNGAFAKLVSEVYKEDFEQQLLELSNETMDMISVENLKRVFARYSIKEFPYDYLATRLSIKPLNKTVVKEFPVDGIVALYEEYYQELHNEQSYLDTLKVMMIQEDNDLSSYTEMIRGIINDEENADVKQGFADSISRSTEEDIRRFVGDIVGLGVERSRMEYVPLTLKFIRYFCEFETEQNIYIEKYIVCNPYIHNSVINELLKEFAELTPAELLDNLIRNDINGSSVYGLNRIADLIYGKMDKEVIRKYLEVATESGKLEIAMVVRDMLRKKMVSIETPVDRISKLELEEESTALRQYSDMLILIDQGKTSGSLVDVSNELGDVFDLSGISKEAIFNMKDIRGMEAWMFIEQNPVFRNLYGPANCPAIDTLLDEDGTGLDVPYEPRLFHMRFNDIGYRLSEGDVDEELMEDPHLCNLRDWFTGYCQYSYDIIPDRKLSFRRPRVRGGWSGSYGSVNSILLEMMQAYDVPADKRKDVLDNVHEQFVRFFREVLGLEDNKLGYAYLAKNRVILLSQDEQPRSAYDIDSPINRMPKIVLKYATETDEPAYDMKKTELQIYGEKLLGSIMEDYPNPQELLRNGGPAKKFEKDVILKREDILVFALTKLYFSYL